MARIAESTFRPHASRTFWIGLLSFAILGMHSQTAYSKPSEGSHTSKRTASTEKNRIVKEGLAIEFDVQSVARPNITGPALIEGQKARIRFSIKDQKTGAPLRGLFPAAWMDPNRQNSHELSCKEKIKSFLQARLAYRPTVDLNSWYLLTLNETASISVINPLIETGASQMLLDLILLKSPGAAWTLHHEANRLYVTLPETGQVAIVDTVNWDVTSYLKTGPRSTQIAFQPDKKYLWVGIDAGMEGESNEGGVAIIDPETQQIVTHIQTGHGHHEIAFTEDSRFAYVTNEQDGTVSVIDIWKLEKIKDIKTGSRPTSLAYSTSAHAFYVMDATQGTIHIIDGSNHKLVTQVETNPGSAVIRFTPDGRWGFVANPTSNVVTILDASVNRITQTVKVGPGPDQIIFSETYAYVRSMGSANISLIELSTLKKGGTVPVLEIPNGTNMPGKLSQPAMADAIAVTPEKAAVVMANPLDESINYYMEGMNAPMGNFGNFQRRPKAVLTIDRGLQETSPGVYEAFVTLDKPGSYDVAFLLDSPQITHCFSAKVEVDPVRAGQRKQGVKLEFLTQDHSLSVGQPTEVRVKLIDLATGKPKTGVEDLRVLAFSAPGTWQKRVWAKPVSDGEYAINLSVPKPGVYYIFFKSASLAVPYRKWPHLVVKAKKDETKHTSNDPGR